MGHRYQNQRAKLYRFLLAAWLMAMVGNLILPSRALAWKPTTHVFLGQIALEDALDNGKVTINRVNYRTGAILGVIGEYDVDPTILAALQSNPAQYHAGILGPDAYPDILTGQQVIHPSIENTQTPKGTEAWLNHLWQQSNQPGFATLPIKAFTVGYLTHAAGDMFGHTFINNFTGGEFVFTPPEGPANAIKHVLLEGYIDKRMDRSNLDPSVFNASIGEGVDNFIYNSLVDARAGTYLGEDLLREGAPGTDFSIPRIFSTLRNQLVQDIGVRRQAAANCSFFDFTCSAVILNLTASYEEAWRDDIDEGLHAWPEVSHKVAIALFFNSQGKTDVETATIILQDYATLHLLSMSGQPDFVGLTIDFVGDVIDAITPDFLLEPIRQLKEEMLNALLKAAIGMDKNDLKKYLTNPELSFDLVMNSGSGENVTLQEMNSTYLHISDPGFSNPSESFDYEEVPATYNTVTMSKLLLLNKSEINRLLSDLGSSARLYQPNVMLGFIPSLDGSRQWLNGMVFAQDSTTYCQVFMLQPGEERINCPPAPQADTYSMASNDPLVVTAPGVLVNDSDPDGDLLVPHIDPTFEPLHGSVEIQANGAFTYTPSGSAVNDLFGYYLSDGNKASRTVLVTISAAPGNQLPVARLDGIYTVTQDTTLTVLAPGVLGNDNDPDGDPLSALVVEQPSNGALSLDPSGRFVYTPTAFFSGVDTFHYKANDGIGDSDSTEVGIEVIANPNVIEAKVDTYVTLKNKVLTIPAPGLLANDTDRDEQPLEAKDPPVSSNLGGLATLHTDGSFTFSPAGDFFGEGEFSYMATDGHADSNVSKTKIIIQATNAAPVAVDNSYAITPSQPLTVEVPGILGNDWDSDFHAEYADFGLPVTDPKTAILVSAPTSGTLALHVDGSFTYTPGVSFNGHDSFTYKLSDGWDESNIATVRISDSSINQAPLASDDLYQTPKNTQLQQAAPGFLTNDTDADGDPLTVLPGRDPLTGAVKLNPDGSFVYSPTIGFEGNDSFTYVIADSLGVTRTATVTVIVGEAVAQNLQPTAANDHATVQQGEAVSITVLANDGDADGDPLTVTLVTQPAHGLAAVSGTQIVYTPQADFTGNDSFTYSVQDGKGGAATATVTIEVLDGPRPPTLTHLPLTRK